MHHAFVLSILEVTHKKPSLWCLIYPTMAYMCVEPTNVTHKTNIHLPWCYSDTHSAVTLFLVCTERWYEVAATLSFRIRDEAQESLQPMGLTPQRSVGCRHVTSSPRFFVFRLLSTRQEQWHTQNEKIQAEKKKRKKERKNNF